MKKYQLPKIISTAGLLIGFTATTHASVVAHWSFENGSFLSDSSGNSNTLTNVGGTSEYSLPASGSGSTFLDPVPNTGLTNSQGALFDRSSTQKLTAADNAAFFSTDFTVEGFFNFTTGGIVNNVVSQWANTGDERSWRLATSAGNRLELYMRRDGRNDATTLGGDDNRFYGNTGVLTVGNDYYFAAIVSVNAASGTSVTLYTQDLTAGGPLLSNTTNEATFTHLYDSSAEFTIGGLADASNTTTLDGLMDEVRYSNTALLESELLITAIPEPSTYGLVTALLMGTTLGYRRMKS